jgi:hypothetical protein
MSGSVERSPGLRRPAPLHRRDHLPSVDMAAALHQPRAVGGRAAEEVVAMPIYGLSAIDRIDLSIIGPDAFL